MNIYEELRTDHRILLGLVDELMTAEDSEERRDLIEEIRDELIPHHRAEEAVLYHSIRDVESVSEVVAQAFKEHVEAETILRMLPVTEPELFRWENSTRKLMDALEKHIKEEEGWVFSSAKKLFTEEEANAMAEVFRKMKPMVKKQSFVGHSMESLANLMPSRLRDSFVKSAKLPISKAS